MSRKEFTPVKVRFEKVRDTTLMDYLEGLDFAPITSAEHASSVILAMRSMNRRLPVVHRSQQGDARSQSTDRDSRGEPLRRGPKAILDDLHMVQFL